MADDGIPEPVRVAWEHAVAGWAEPARHELFLVQVVQHNCFTWAAARYKERAGDPIAERQLERLRSSATAALLATATARKPASQPYRATMGVLLALVVATICGLVYAMLLHQTHRGAAITQPGAR